MDIGAPFVLGCVGVSGPDVAGLQLLELLLCAQFVGLCFTKVSAGRKKKGKKGEVRKEEGGRGIWTIFIDSDGRALTRGVV